MSNIGKLINLLVVDFGGNNISLYCAPYCSLIKEGDEVRVEFSGANDQPIYHFGTVIHVFSHNKHGKDALGLLKIFKTNYPLPRIESIVNYKSVKYPEGWEDDTDENYQGN